jgi:hypothetical protein
MVSPARSGWSMRAITRTPRGVGCNPMIIGSAWTSARGAGPSGAGRAEQALKPPPNRSRIAAARAV